jgi:YVTN family beta-propeller protein
MKIGVLLAGFACALAGIGGCGQPRPTGDPGTTTGSGPTATGAEAFGNLYLAPVAVQTWGQEGRLLVLGSVGRRIVILDPGAGGKRHILPLPAAATGIAARGDTAYVTTAEPAGRVLAVDLNTGALRRQWRVGHTPMAPVLSPDGARLYVANRFDNAVALIDLAQGPIRTVPVVREPVALALTRDGRRLFVANHLPCVRLFEDEENPVIAAEVSVIDTEQGRLLKNIELPNGSQGLRGIALSPDGRQVAVTHVLSNYLRPTTQIETGLMNRNALSLLDTESLQWLATVVLDDPDHGAANPWAVVFSGDGRRLLITHAGTHELSVIDYPALLERIATRPQSAYPFAEQDLTMLAGIRRRIALGVNGPRALLERDGIVYVPGFFSDNLAIVDLHAVEPSAHIVALAEPARAPVARLGEQYFNDATVCRQQWQSCATCHPDGRSDSLYWDLLNDGLGNTKNTKSLLMSALTPPVMWRGVRADAETGIRAGFEHIEFTEPNAQRVRAISAYLREMPVVPGPGLNAVQLESPKTEQASCGKCHYPGVPRGSLTAAARRGKALFEGKAGCAACHPHPAFTSGQKADPGLGSGVLYDVPSLVEVWRTAPYLHSGDALTLREAITDFNWRQKRGRTKDLSEQELDDLLEYLQAL